ncbi:MAG: helix-turn-helix domain-containing protein, partial [Alphaproteobacteria bacterium]|nr:helix-turn-helix domain-containing protein [Alphaproteobacteria bacterium]
MWTFLTWETGKKQPTYPHWPGIIRFLGYDPHPEPMTLGERLRAAYRRLGLPQTHVARTIGMDPATLYRYEAGDWVPGSPRTRQLLDLLLGHAGTVAELRDDARAINKALPYPDPPVTVGDQLRKRRHELGWTQDQV